MSFSKTISVVAALGSIFSVGLASWKISEDIKNEQTAPLEQKIQELEKKLEEPKQQLITPIPAPVILPPAQTQVPQLPSPPPPVPPVEPSTSTP
jgi:hypothetical protein